jgi:hypothetical protein
MTISHFRLRHLLLPQGFADSQVSRASMTFFRKDTREGLFQKIHVDFQGSYNEAVYGNVSASVARYLFLKIDLRHHLMELDTDKERNWTIIETIEQAKTWEKRFAEVAPATAETFARERGNELLERTGHARHRSADHLRRLDPTKSIHQQVINFETANGSEFRRHAEKLAEWPGVMQVPDADEVYVLACCAVVSGNEESAFVGQDPLQNDELMWQIQLVADGILSWERQK